MNRERLEILIVKFYKKELNNDEKVEFENLLKTQAEARKLFHSWNFVNQSLEAFDLHDEINDNEIIPSETVLLKKSKSGKKRRWLVNIAAAIAFPLALMVGYLYYLQNKEDIVYNEVTCCNGRVISILLSDSSVIHLFAGSTLRYPAKFTKDRREVYLIGEANFQVKAHSEYPFIVSTIKGYKIKAYGTKFIVQDYPKSDNILVYLNHGVVDFESPTLPTNVTLNPNTELFHLKNSNKYSIREIGSKEYDAYETGTLVFTSRHLNEIAKKLEQVYRVNIEIEDNKELTDYRFTATFRNESIYSILNILKMSSPGLDWKEENGKIILTKS